MQIEPILFLSFLASVFGWFWWHARLRRAQIRALADSLGFHFLGDALPKSFPMGTTLFESVTAVWNVMDGEPRGRRIVAFDCRFGEGKGSWRRTVIAVQTEIGELAPSGFDVNTQIEQIRNWVIIWRPKELSLIPTGVMAIAELRAHLEQL